MVYHRRQSAVRCLDQWLHRAWASSRSLTAAPTMSCSVVPRYQQEPAPPRCAMETCGTSGQMTRYRRRRRSSSRGHRLHQPSATSRREEWRISESSPKLPLSYSGCSIIAASCSSIPSTPGTSQRRRSLLLALDCEVVGMSTQWRRVARLRACTRDESDHAHGDGRSERRPGVARGAPHVTRLSTGFVCAAARQPATLVGQVAGCVLN